MRRFRYLILALSILGLALVPSALALKIDPAQPPNGFVGVPYSFQFKPEDGQGCTPYKWKYLTGALPPGLSISTDDGIMSGTPTTKGDYQFYVDLESCAGNHTQRQFKMTIAEKLTITSPSPLPSGKINEAYPPYQLTASGGTVNAWTIQSGALPAGMSLSPAGVVSGTPTQSGSFEILVIATGSTGSDNKRIQISISEPLALNGPGGVPPKSQPVALNTKVGEPFNWAVVARGGKTPYTYTSSPTELPDGLTLNPDGTIMGQATTAGTSRVTFTVTDGAGTTATLAVVFNVKALLAFTKTGKPPVGRVGKTFRWKIPVTGASKTKTYLASGSFPPGLSLDEVTGLMTGKPVQAGRFKVKIWVLGDTGTQISKRFTVKVTA